MKILVGVIHCIENEFEQCLSAINQQSHAASGLFIISGRRNKEAHDLLYGTFMERSGEADIFIKVDADMVLTRPTLFGEIAEKFRNNPELEHLKIAVDDYFTNSRIIGLHAFRSTHRWQKNNELHFVDTVNTDQTVLSDRQELAPAAIHCPDPSPFQAFHFGIHKAVKVLQYGRQDKNYEYSLAHWNYFCKLEHHYYQTHGVNLGLAVLGFLLAIQERYGPAEVDFDCLRVKKAFSKCEFLSKVEIQKAINKQEPSWRRQLPSGLRYVLAASRATAAWDLGGLFNIIKAAVSNRSS